MGRPRKKGLDYFPFDTDFFSDPKIRILKARFGTDGIGVYIYILCDIYRQNGYYLQADDDLEFIIADELKLSPEKVKQVLAYLYSRSLLIKRDISILATPVTVVTSTGIQRRYQQAVKDRASKNVVEVRSDVWLLSSDETETSIKVLPSLNKSEKNEGFSEKNGGNSGNKCTNKIKENKYIDIYTPSADPTVYFDDSALNTAFAGYLQMRKDLGQTLTKTQIELLSSSVLKLSEDNEERVKIVKEATIHGWKGFYPLKKEAPKKSSSNGSNSKPRRRKNSFNDFEQRTYDKSLESKLLSINKEGDNDG